MLYGFGCKMLSSSKDYDYNIIVAHWYLCQVRYFQSIHPSISLRLYFAKVGHFLNDSGNKVQAYSFIQAKILKYH